MPTVFRHRSYRFFFYSCDRDEPAHIHVEREDRIAKIWLNPIRLESSGGLSRIEIGQILRIVDKNQRRLVEAWNEYFGG
jgi:hypothetical protein